MTVDPICPCKMLTRHDRKPLVSMAVEDKCNWHVRQCRQLIKVSSVLVAESSIFDDTDVHAMFISDAESSTCTDTHVHAMSKTNLKGRWWPDSIFCTKKNLEKERKYTKINNVSLQCKLDAGRRKGMLFPFPLCRDSSVDHSFISNNNYRKQKRGRKKEKKEKCRFLYVEKYLSFLLKNIFPVQVTSSVHKKM